MLFLPEHGWGTTSCTSCNDEPTEQFTFDARFGAGLSPGWCCGFPHIHKKPFLFANLLPLGIIGSKLQKKQHRLLQSCFPWRRHVTFRLSNLLVQSLLSGWICPVRLNLLLCQVEFAPPFEEKNFPQPNPLVFQNPSTNTFSGTREV